MDQILSEYAGNPIVVTGMGFEVPAGLSIEAPLAHDADPLPLLRVRKTAKFMSKQDRLALAAAARAVQSSGLSADLLETQTRIAMCVGPIPFEKSEAMQMAERACLNESFSMEHFCRDAYAEVNPLLLFACLPNMPAYHISANLNIRGGYYLTYPSGTESYLALWNAVDALADGQVAAVLFGGVADQQNFLVQNHHRKTGQTLPAPDGAAFLVLESLRHAQARQAQIRARLQGLRLLTGVGATGSARPCFWGPVELPLNVAQFTGSGDALLTQRLVADGYVFESVWTK